MGSKLRLSSAYHPQTDGQSERTIQSLEDLLRVCVLEQGGTWDSHLPLIEFTYNNSYHSSIGMTPFEALYGHENPIIEENEPLPSKVNRVDPDDIENSLERDPGKRIPIWQYPPNKRMQYEERI